MKSLGYITDMSKCHDVGMWCMDQNIFHFMLKNTHLAACSGPPMVCDGPLGAPGFLKLAY